MAIVRNNGYVQLRRGLFEHVQNGEMSIGECFLYMAILANADPATGVWISSAGMLSNYFLIPERTCRDWLEKLEQKQFLRRFRVRGEHTQYPIAIHKFECTDGAVKGMRLNAWRSTSYLDLKYEQCRDGAGAGAVTVPESTREERKGKYIPPPSEALDLDLLQSATLPDNRAAAVIEQWNIVTAGKLPKARLTSKRQTLIRARLKEAGWFSDFSAACLYITETAFYRGDNDRGWVANIDFVFQAGRATELAEKSTVQSGLNSNGHVPKTKSGYQQTTEAELKEIKERRKAIEKAEIN